MKPKTKSGDCGPLNQEPLSINVDICYDLDSSKFPGADNPEMLRQPSLVLSTREALCAWMMAENTKDEEDTEEEMPAFGSDSSNTSGKCDLFLLIESCEMEINDMVRNDTTNSYELLDAILDPENDNDSVVASGTLTTQERIYFGDAGDEKLPQKSDYCESQGNELNILETPTNDNKGPNSINQGQCPKCENQLLLREYHPLSETSIEHSQYPKKRKLEDEDIKRATTHRHVAHSDLMVFCGTGEMSSKQRRTLCRGS